MGYAGLSIAVCFAELGHQVVGMDTDAAKVSMLEAGRLPIFEPGLDVLMARTKGSERLRFTTDYETAISDAEFVFIAVGTPPDRRGETDLVFVKRAAKGIARAMKKTVTIVSKSTVPVGTADVISRIVAENLRVEIPFYVVSNPEFLRQGNAIDDFMHPDRLVFGSHDERAARAASELYKKLDTKILITDLHTAEMIKYASNAFLAMRISFINEMARISERVGADINVVSEGMGLDHRIGPLFLKAGLGYGGSSLSKDVRALTYTADTMGYHPQLLNAVTSINLDQRTLLVEKAREVLGDLRNKVIGLLGLAYKPNTDDIREAPSVDIIERLLQRGAQIRAYDPKAMLRLKQHISDIQYCVDPYSAADGADALLVATEWSEFRSLDFGRVKGLMRQPIIIDGRNMFDPTTMRDLGFVYRGIGRS
jgi:UDPglucose 6-dehydrogenase